MLLVLLTKFIAWMELFIGKNQVENDLKSVCYMNHILYCRRFPKMLYIELPDLDERENILRSIVGKLQTTASIDFHSLAIQTER